MLSKKLIIEKYIGDLKNHVPQSPARDQRLEMLENELEAIKNLDDIDDVAESCEGCNIQHIDNHSDRMICVTCDDKF
jgi:hypothetical protein